MLERRVVPPWGAFGGSAGAPYRITLTRDGTARDVKGKETVRLRSGDVVVIETCGGGGYGDPAARSPELAVRDRIEGYVPAESARPTVTAGEGALG
jgi:N-methylhydantoinase B